MLDLTFVFEKTRHWFNRRLIYHSLIWLGFLAFLIFNSDDSFSFFERLSNEIINIGLYAILVYFNLYYLIPNYLKSKSIGRYLFLLVIFSFFLTPIKLVIFYLKLSNQPVYQAALLNNFALYFIINLIIGGSSTIAKIVKDYTKNQKEKQLLEHRNMHNELQFLKSQINPHFLFNTLNNIYSLTLKKSDLAPEMVLKLSDMMRYMLYECNAKRVPLKKEITYLQNYIELESIRFKNRGTIKFNLDVVEDEDLHIAPLLFIPFMENAIKHGVNQQIENAKVSMSLKVQNGVVEFCIKNNKNAESAQGPGGIGLVNVRRRLNLIYPKAHELEIQDLKEYYIVSLKINLNHDKSIDR
jgi:sensor histidine kinase YesM